MTNQEQHVRRCPVQGGKIDDDPSRWETKAFAWLNPDADGGISRGIRQKAFGQLTQSARQYRIGVAALQLGTEVCRRQVKELQ
jgi:hypothetical protein